MKHIVWLSDFDLNGSGYKNISIPSCLELQKWGYELKAIGMGYQGSEHDFDLSIIPAQNLRDAMYVLLNLIALWGVDVLVVALDITLQEMVFQEISTFNSKNDGKIKYIGIMPLEADPLVFSHAAFLSRIDKAFVISKFGVEEFKRMGIDAEYYPVGIDSIAWRMRTEEERKSLRGAFGFSDDDFVVLTVADNHERKYLSAGIQIIAKVKEEVPNVKYVLVTREHISVGWKLRDLANEYGISDSMLVFERGLDFTALWTLYAISDAFLLPSKAEGLGMPILEAMAVGVPVVATDCSAITEQLEDGRGFLVLYDYKYRDPFGNQWRYFIDIDAAAMTLFTIAMAGAKKEIDLARAFVEERVWIEPVMKLHQAILALYEDENEESPS